MDLLTQGLVGSAAAQSFSGPKTQYRAALCGALAGMAPDLDTLIRSPDDPLLNLEYHRHFSHALAFIPLGALIVALLIWLASRRRWSFRQTYTACLLGYGSHGLLDACTSYGTYLFWPFSSQSVSWNLVSIIDPLFTLPLLFLTILAVWRRRAWMARLAAIYCIGYLLLAAGQHRRAGVAQSELIIQRNHGAVKKIIKPSIGNVFLHRSVYLHDGVYYVDAIHVFPGLPAKLYPGGKIKAMGVQEVLPRIKDNSRQAKDVSRFSEFSGGYLCRHPELDDVLGDIRYAMLPTSTVPLWGIKVNPGNPESPPEFVKSRKLEEGQMDHFFGMLLRRDSPAGNKEQDGRRN
jgi:inner membrane protein